MSGFRIGSQSEFLDVKIVGRSHASQDYWDGNWLNADIQIATGGFHGRFGAYLRAEELKIFHDSLMRLYSFDTKAVKFETMEEQLSIGIQGDSLGHFTAECEARDQAGIGNRLSFTLNFDQTELPEILKGLEEALKEFPVIGNPND
jgi:hypothetical protein